MGDQVRGDGTGTRAVPDLYPDTDLKIVIYTATPGSEDEAKLELTRVVGVL